MASWLGRLGPASSIPFPLALAGILDAPRVVVQRLGASRGAGMSALADPGVLGASAEHHRHRPVPGRRQRARDRARRPLAAAAPSAPRAHLGHGGARSSCGWPGSPSSAPCWRSRCVQLAGGLLLLWIAVKLVRPRRGARGTRCARGTSLREAIWIIVVADVTMSLDNVLGRRGGGRTATSVLVVFGIALSLPIVVWGSGLLAAPHDPPRVDHLDRRRDSRRTWRAR